MPDDETIVVEKTASPAGMTSRRQAIGVMGTTVSAGMVGAMPALGAPAQAATPLREPVPPPVLVPRTDLVNVLEYEPRWRCLGIGTGEGCPDFGQRSGLSPIASRCVHE